MVTDNADSREEVENGQESKQNFALKTTEIKGFGVKTKTLEFRTES